MTTPSNLPAIDEPAPDLAQIEPSGGLGRWAARIIGAAIVISLGIAAYFYFGQHKPVATGDIARISLYPIHTIMKDDSDQPGMAGAAESYDQLLVFAQVRVHNQSDAPLTITEIMGNVILPIPVNPDQSEPSSRAASLSDFNRLFSAYPRLAPLHMDPLLRDTTIAPGQSADGLLLFNYSMTKEAWDQRRNFSVAISFSNGTVVHLDGTHS